MGLRFRVGWRIKCAVGAGFCVGILLAQALITINADAGGLAKVDARSKGKKDPLADVTIDFHVPADLPPGDCGKELSQLSTELSKMSYVNSSGATVGYKTWADAWTARVESIAADAEQAPATPHWSAWLAPYEGRQVADGAGLLTSRRAIEIVFRMARIHEYKRFGKIIPKELFDYRWILADLSDVELLKELLDAVSDDAVAPESRLGILNNVWKFLEVQRPHWRFSRQEEGNYVVFGLNGSHIISEGGGMLYFSRGNPPRDERGEFKLSGMGEYPPKAKKAPSLRTAE